MSSESKVSVLRGDVAADAGAKTVFKVLLAISFCHLLNDTVQSLLPAIYPLLRDTFHLDFGQIGLISFTSTFTASLLQPLVGLYSDRHHKRYFLRSRHAWRAWLRAGSTAWRNRCSRSEATQDRYWGLSWRRLYCRAGNEASLGFRSWRCWG